MLHGRSRFDHPALFVTRPVAGGEEEVPLEVDGRDFTARLPIRPIIEETNPDDPFSQRTTRAFRMRGREGQEQVLLWTAGDRPVSHAEGGRVVMADPVDRWVREPARVPDPDDSHRCCCCWQHVGGARSGLGSTSGSAGGGTWPAPTTHVDVACRRTVSDDGWAAVVDVDALRPGEVPADWILFATALDGSSHAVQCEPFLSSRLPLTISRGSHALAVRPLAGTLHVEVR